MDRSVIDQYREGGTKLSLAVRGLKREDLLCAPPADADVGRWSIQQVVIHTVDSDLVLADRMKRIIAEENPTLLAFDENRWVERLAYAERSAEDAVTLLDLNRKDLAAVLATLPDEAFGRKGNHSERGPLTLEQVLRTATGHLEHHVKFIHDKRAHWGKEMW